jgi:hypothetical protein
VRAQVFERLTESIRVFSILPSDDIPHGEAPAEGARSAGQTGQAGHVLSDAARAPAPLGFSPFALVSAHPWVFGLATFALGVGAGWGGARGTAAPPQTVYVDRVVTSVAPTVTVTVREPAIPFVSTVSALPGVPSALPGVAVVSRAPTAVASGAAAPAVAQEHDDQLAAERALLALSKTAIGRRDYAAALDNLDRHTREFPRGQLAEEREALAIQALQGLGRASEARARATRFKATYPRSMLMPIIDAALQ